MKNRIRHQIEGFLDTPPLWENQELFDLKQFNNPWKRTLEDLENIDREIPALSSNFVLGKRMESFFEYLLKRSGKHKLLGNNIQIQKEKITLGEIDFLAEDFLRNLKIHIELVYKFYIYDPSFTEELERWIGPNRKDSLLRKIYKLREKQLPLLYKTETQKILRSLNLKPEDLEQEVCFKANLFVPKHLLSKQLEHVNNNCISGYWIRFKEFTSEDYEGLQFFSPRKQDWPILPENNQKWFSFSEIKEQIEIHFNRGNSPLVWMKRNDSQFERFFVVWW